MSEDYEEAQVAEDNGMTGPGAPTPLSALEVRGRADFPVVPANGVLL